MGGGGSVVICSIEGGGYRGGWFFRNVLVIFRAVILLYRSAWAASCDVKETAKEVYRLINPAAIANCIDWGLACMAISLFV